MQLQTDACRKLVDPGCYSSDPPSALDVVQRLGPGLGPIVVVDVGYNDIAATYAAGLDEVMNALVTAGVQHVIWVTLTETQEAWSEIDQAIRAAPARWPQLTVADWAPVAAGQPWFNDIAHLNYDGAVALATFLRPYLLTACGAACAPPPPTFCGLARTVNGFDPVSAVKGISCPRARAAVRDVERGAPGPWVCSRAVHATFELDCRTSGAEVQVLERSPVAGDPPRCHGHARQLVVPAARAGPPGAHGPRALADPRRAAAVLRPRRAARRSRRAAAPADDIGRRLLRAALGSGPRGVSSAGRASALQAEGHRFDPGTLHSRDAHS